MGDVGSDTGPEDNVVEGELADARVELEQEGQRLTNASGRAKDDDLAGLWMSRYNHVSRLLTFQ